MTYYLKYRPQKIKDLDLMSVRQELTEILSGKNLPHAFLFCGPKGTGKTSSARIVAKAVNCLKPLTRGEPCNKCESCQMINSGRALDLIEIDAASNRGIDDIRDLREKIKLAPFKAKYKIYIVDEVHMLTTEAFNALLKTLEEPPAHAKFILCTTEAQKLPETIISRCSVIKFHKATAIEMCRSLKRVAEGEELKIDDKDLARVAKLSGGSFRDGVKILEQLAQTGKKIDAKRIAEILDKGRMNKSLDEWLILVYQGQAVKALTWLAEGLNEGLQIREFIIEGVERLRQILLNRLGVKLENFSDITEINDLERLKTVINKLMVAGKELKGAVIESLPLELMVAELATVSETKETAVAPNLTKKSGKLDLKTVEEKWKEILEAVRPHNHSLEALLKATKPSGFDGKYLAIQVYYKFHKERLEVDRYRQLIEEIISKILNQSVSIRYFLGEKMKPAVKQEEENVSAKVDDDIIKTAEEIFGKGVE